MYVMYAETLVLATEVKLLRDNKFCELKYSIELNLFLSTLSHSHIMSWENRVHNVGGFATYFFVILETSRTMIFKGAMSLVSSFWLWCCYSRESKEYSALS